MRANASQCLNFKNQFYSQKRTYLKAQHPASLVACSDAQGLPGYFTVLLIMLSFSTRGNLHCKFWLLILVNIVLGTASSRDIHLLSPEAGGRCRGYSKTAGASHLKALCKFLPLLLSQPWLVVCGRSSCQPLKSPARMLRCWGPARTLV